ncbi:MAG: hypothetical protein KIS76_06660 [Pyrinomonadaceae bacterium]|nr:hypothetical protein [Pyrinomonadaceae bacterium]
MPRKSIPIDSIYGRAILAGLTVLVAVFSVIAAKWSFANSISTQAEHIEVAELAIEMAPDDPQAHYALAVLTERTFLPQELERSLSEFKKAAMLSPHDFRLWIALGKAFERAGDDENAALSFKNAKRLAPNYAQVAWIYGNFLVRTGDTENAFAEIRRAAEADRQYLRPAVATAFQILGGDLAQIRKLFGDSMDLNAMLAASLGGSKKFDEALEIWNSLPESDRRTKYSDEGAALYRQLIDAKHFREALKINNQTAKNDNLKFEAQTIYNGGFEADLTLSGAPLFDWNLAGGLQPQVLFDAGQKREGSRSIVFLFNSIDGRDFRGLSQTIVVSPGSSYRLGFSYRSQFKSAATFTWQIVDPAGELLGESEPIDAESEWEDRTVNFTVPDQTEAVTIRLARAKCPDGICPINGRVWFDNFELSQANSGTLNEK